MKKRISLLLAIAMVFSVLPFGFGALADEAVFEKTVDWDAEYDVIVVGLGAAGSAAAITAAQQGAKVLVLEKAPEGHAGGNSAVCMQWAAMVEDKEKATTYMESMREGFETPTDEMISVYLDGLSKNEQWFIDLGAPNVTRYDKWIEFPDMDGAGGIIFVTVDGNTGIPQDDKALIGRYGMKGSGRMYKFLKSKVESFDNIDIWYEAPAAHLIQDVATKIVHGVEANIDGRAVRVRAKNGVVLCCGGYENNPRMLEDFNDIHNSASLGYALYNTGDGIMMALEAGARLWHMSNIVWPNPGYEYPSGAVTFCTFTQGGMNVGADGKIFKSIGSSNHGKTYFSGNYIRSIYPNFIWAIYDKNGIGEQFIHNSFSAGNAWEIEHGVFESAETLEALAEKLGMPAETVAASAATFNETAKFPLLEGPFYAIKIVPAVCNTQGGPERGIGGEVIAVDGSAIPHLYEAGELGDVWSHCYQASCNIGGGLAYGRISGANAAAPKSDNWEGSVMEGKEAYVREIAEPVYEAGENQFIGKGDGKGQSPIVVRVTVEGQDIKDVEILEDYETPGLTDRAKETIIAAVIEQDTPYVDIVSGCTMTSVGLMAAVNDAVSQAK